MPREQDSHSRMWSTTFNLFAVTFSVQLLLNLHQVFIKCAFQVPTPVLEAIYPKGIRISIPEIPGIQAFRLHGKINRKINLLDAGDFSAEITPTNGKYSMYIPNVQLEIGDTVNYWTSAQVNRLGYRKDGQQWKVIEFKRLTETAPSAGCITSETVFSLSKKTCVNDLLFEYTFKTDNLSDWTKQNRRSDVINGPDFEFNYYKNLEENIFVKNDILHLKPTRKGYDFNDLYGNLDITSDSCSSKKLSECTKQSYEIVPPLVSGQVKSRVPFKYGRVEIEAKLPKGDWIYPQMYLEPKENFYGNGFASGRMMIAFSRGNVQLRTNSGGEELGSSVLYGGVVLGRKDSARACGLRQTRLADSGKSWHSDYHKFTLTWTPNEISVSVDDKQYGTISPPLNGGFTECLKDISQPETNTEKPWTNPIAPFDQEFTLTLGVGVGGFNDFPDNIKSGQTPKPWRNEELKALIFFFRDHDNWYKTWKDDDVALKIKSVKVFAI